MHFFSLPSAYQFYLNTFSFVPSSQKCFWFSFFVIPLFWWICLYCHQCRWSLRDDLVRRWRRFWDDGDSIGDFGDDAHCERFEDVGETNWGVFEGQDVERYGGWWVVVGSWERS